MWNWLYCVRYNFISSKSLRSNLGIFKITNEYLVHTRRHYCLTFGIYITMRQVKIFAKGKQDRLGFDIQSLGAGIMFIMIGIYLIFKYL
jgi:hypothetical protein